jgi:RNA-directed DNA polymerase
MNAKQTDLLPQLAAPDNLLLAWRQVRGNIPRYRRARSAGPDGVSLLEFERELSAQLETLRLLLLEGRYHPEAPAWFEQPKNDGGVRRLAVLTVRDRVAQRAAQQVIEPLWEPLFLDCSFGYRPGTSVEQAIACAQTLRRSGNPWVVDGDILACFDRLDHDLLMNRLQRRIGDKRVLRLLEAWLDAGVVAAGPQTSQRSVPLSGGQTPEWLQHGLDVLTEAASADPYPSARYRRETDPYGADRYDHPAPGELTVSGQSTEQRRWALKRLIASGALWGASFARPAAAAAGNMVKTTLATPAGRRILRRGAAASGGLAGVALVAALTAWVLKRKAGPAPAGVLQGSPLSPLLANIYLHSFDFALQRKGLHLVRFADDWVICAPDQAAAEKAYNQALIALARLLLQINRHKTCLHPPGEPFPWLGGTIY